MKSRVTSKRFMVTTKKCE